MPYETIGHDLDPNADGDLVKTIGMENQQSTILAINSTSGENISASVKWQDGDGNLFQEESASDLALSGITDDWARLVRKGPKAEVTVTSEVGAGTTNLVNFYVGGSG